MAGELELDMKQLQKLLKTLDRRSVPSSFLSHWRGFMLRKTGQLRRGIRKLIQQEGPIGVSREYFGSLTRAVTGRRFDLVGRVFHDGPASEYAMTIETGRTPGERQPPREELIPWIEDKLDATDENFDVLDPEEVERTAAALAQLIGTEGTFQPGQGTLESKQDNVEDAGMQHFSRTLDDQTPRIVKEALETLGSYVDRSFKGL